MVLAIETLAARSQDAAGALAHQQAAVDALANAAQPPSFSDIKRRLQVNGGNALDVTGLLGVLAQPQIPGVPLLTSLPVVNSSNNGELVNLNGTLYYYDGRTDPGSWQPIGTGAIYADTHANRLTNFPPGNYIVGTLFWETDRFALYRVRDNAGTKVWTLMLTRPASLNSILSRPADLGVEDAGYLVTITGGLGQFWQRWDGTNWIFHLGWYMDAEANRPVVASCSVGFVFVSIDYNYQAWFVTFGAWQLWPGFGGPASGTLGAIPGALGLNDAGFVYYATDFDREYVWTGSGWVDGDGQEARFQIVWFPQAPEVNGWQICDGSTVTRSTAGGGTTSYTVPDMTTNLTFIRSGLTNGTGTFGAVGAAYNYLQTTPYIRL